MFYLKFICDFNAKNMEPKLKINIYATIVCFIVGTNQYVSICSNYVFVLTSLSWMASRNSNVRFC